MPIILFLYLKYNGANLIVFKNCFEIFFCCQSLDILSDYPDSFKKPYNIFGEPALV